MSQPPHQGPEAAGPFQQGTAHGAPGQPGSAPGRPGVAPATPGQSGQPGSAPGQSGFAPAAPSQSGQSGAVYSGGSGPYAPQPFGASFGAPPEPAPKLPWSRAIAVTVAVFLVAGAIAGWAWQQYAPLAQYTIDDNGGSLGEEQMTRVFGPDGTFVAIGFLTALLLGAALFWWLRDYGPWAVAVVAVGSVIGSAVAWGVGMLLGHDPLEPRLQAAKPGDLLAAPLELHTWTPLASWLVGAALAAAIIAALTWRAEPVATTSVSAASESSAQVK
ncbi:hypothetical protein [Kribbella sp. ALI-6-A]|uniref:hypothetical protein n=1 Tax=Kribbella sp. ALI-6-A TaxID=1933817 RepID=UPI001EDA395D|nr:hypothetical protein [Kribbella sp. ALI-6-A]